MDKNFMATWWENPDDYGYVNQHGLSRKVRSLFPSRRIGRWMYLVAHIWFCQGKPEKAAARLHRCTILWVGAHEQLLVVAQLYHEVTVLTKIHLSRRQWVPDTCFPVSGWFTPIRCMPFMMSSRLDMFVISAWVLAMPGSVCSPSSSCPKIHSWWLYPSSCNAKQVSSPGSAISVNKRQNRLCYYQQLDTIYCHAKPL